VLGHGAGFWLRLEANYQQDLVRLQQLDELASQKDWLKELPLRWMQRQGWVETCSHAGQQVSACLKFFAVASIEAWRELYGQPLAVYRTSKTYATQQGALACWLRRAETEAGAIDCRPYEAKTFRAALQQMRNLSCATDPTVFVPQLQALAGTAGAAVALAPLTGSFSRPKATISARFTQPVSPSVVLTSIQVVSSVRLVAVSTVPNGRLPTSSPLGAA
jgi:HTH-type transcriptional regulator/antitoxin HigA